MKTKAAVLYEMGRAAPYARSCPLVIADVTLDGPGPGEVLVEIAAAGLCHSDLSVVNSSRPRVMPMVLGHEASGIVRECGAGVMDLRLDDPVVFSYVPLCGRCLPCATGRPALCENGAATNTAGTAPDGDFSQPNLTQMNCEPGKHGRRHIVHIFSRHVNLVVAILKPQAFQRATVRVKQPVVGNPKAAIPVSLGLAVVQFMAGADRFDHEFGRNAKPAIEDLSSLLAFGLERGLLLQLPWCEENRIHLWHPDVVDHQINFKSKITGDRELCEMILDLVH
jgi:hypothetical protein